MPSGQVVGGIVQLQLSDGGLLNASGNFEWNLGNPKREPVLGYAGTQVKEMPQVAFISGEIIVDPSTDVDAITKYRGGTVSLALPGTPSRTFLLRSAWFAGEGTVSTEEGKMAVRFEGASGELV